MKIHGVVVSLLCGALIGVGEGYAEPRPLADDLPWPVEGPIVRPFHPEEHRGVDLEVPKGTPVTAVLEGTVVAVDPMGGNQHAVVVEHDPPWRTIYVNVEDVRVREGSSVARGEPLGQIGSEGVLHYEIRRSKEAMDPEGSHRTASRPREVAVERDDQDSEPRPRSETVETEPRAGTETPESETVEARSSGATQVQDGSVGHTAILLGANVLYVPAKMAYASLGAFVGAAGTLLSGDTVVAQTIWSSALGGDYYVQGRHLSRLAPLRFMGAADPESETGRRSSEKVSALESRP